MSPVLSRQAGTRIHHVRLLGTGSSTPTKEIGHGITVSRTAAGVYKCQWALGASPGTFLGFTWGLGASTPGDVKGHTVTRSTITAETSSAGYFISVSLWNASDAADDLQATEYMDLTFHFKTVSI